ncbi:MAG TPA: GNAT family N-acetyltransferase [Steroidobacteraceae bacterium]|nr:GNAT family N-acetyltransferase [Steroidobacteraceae bacterium]
MKIELLDRPEVRVACLRYDGPSGEPLDRFWRRRVAPWLAEYGLLDCPRYGIALGAGRYEACVEVFADVSLPDARPATIDGGLYAITRFRGTGAELDAAWKAFEHELHGDVAIHRDEGRPALEHYPRGAGYDARTGAFACELCLPMQSRYRLADAQPDDAPAILELQKLAYRSEAQLYDDWSLPPLTQTLESLRAEFASSRILKAVDGEHLVGAVRAREADGVCHVGRLIVTPQLQGRGIGTRLMRAIEARFPGARRFELFTGSRSVGNLRLYERLGYRRCREQVLSPAVTLVYLEKLR